MAVLGIDEVGRGPWAGPLVVGAVVLCGENVEGLTDSKKLTAKRREVLARQIRESGAGIGLGWGSAGEVDKIGLGEALRLATRRAVAQVRVSYHEIIIDGTVNLLAGTKLEGYVTTLAKADALISEVSAASIVAKVARDAYMVRLAEKYPDYGFERHVGYGTRAHVEALRKYGVTPEHRLSFRPVAEALDSETSNRLSSGALSRARLSSQGAGAAVGLEVGASSPSSTRAREPEVCRFHSRPITTKQIGDMAETVVVEYLERSGHEIVARNWKTQFCEIDIVSRKGEYVYFTEVKYRRDRRRGGGVEAVTQEKLHKMKFAAESYMKYSGLDASPILAVGVVSGVGYDIDDWFTID